MTYVATVIFSGLSKHLCSTEGCHASVSIIFWWLLITTGCVLFFPRSEWLHIHLLWALPSGWFMLVQAISFNGCVVVAGCLCSKILSGTTSVFCEHHLLVCSCYFRLYLLMVLVRFCFWLCFFCSLILNVATSFLEQGLEFVLWLIWC